MPRRANVVRRAVSSVVENLESRTLLTTVVGGGIDPFTGLPLATRFTYQDASDHIVDVFVGGNTTVELIGGRVPGLMGPGPGPANVMVPSDLIAPGLPATAGLGIDLFQIYVSQSDSRSFVTVSQRTGNGNNLIPFAGDAGAFQVQGIDGLTTITPNGGTGSLLLGARTKDVITTTTDEEDRPIVSVPNPGAFGVRPATSGRLVAGFQVAAGHNFGKFFFGGTVTGVVSVPGSMESFYAGNVWTGDAGGLGTATAFRTGKRSPNFYIGGDLHSLFVTGSIGTNNDALVDRPEYLTGFDMQVLGELGQVSVGDSILGGVNVIHGAIAKGFGGTIEEVEGRSIRSSTNIPALGWMRGMLEGDPAVYNDSFATPQILPSFPGRKFRSAVVVNGQLQADARILDYVDYYAMPLLAGQPMTVQLTPTGLDAGFVGIVRVGVYDPDGRLIATDYANVDTLAVAGKPLRITADRPGLYRIAVAVSGDADFNGPGGEFGIVNQGNVTYQLSITGGGDLPLGGVIAGNNIYDAQTFGSFGFFVQNGDFGALQAGGTIFSQSDLSIVTRVGSLRSVEGGSIGLNTQQFSSHFNLDVPKGVVGLVRSTTGILQLNSPSFIPIPVGVDYQVISAATTLQGQIIADRSIGVIRAGDMATRTRSVIVANADETGADGIIDLIDVAGDFGTLNSGGPAISTGPGGDVRYINVGGIVYRDRFFGGGTPEATTYAPGESVHLTDDSGAKIELDPFPLAPNPAFVPGGTNPVSIGPTLTVTAYGIQGSGGVAVINVTSTGSVRVGGGGGSTGNKAHVEIGKIVTTGRGNPVVLSTNSGTLIFSSPTQGQGTGAVNLDVLIDGSAKVDVYGIEGSDFTSIRNKTSGEIVSINATINPVTPAGFTNNGTIGSLEATTIGLAEHTTPAAVNGINVVSNVFPFNQQHNAIISGNILNVQATGGIGNLDVTGSIGNITANSNGRHTTSRFEGIAGPIVVSSNVASVEIGDGILPSGSGNLSRAGLYVGGQLGTVSNGGLSSDIRGDIISKLGITKVTLTDGAIIGAKIGLITDFAMSRRFTASRTIPGTTQSVNNPIFDVGEISVGGVGGIIGSDFFAVNYGPVTVRRGFGIINSRFSGPGGGRIGAIEAEGYGLRGDVFRGGASLTSLSASAKPRNVSVLNYSTSVRESERYLIDPFFDQTPSRETDLHVYLGTSARKPRLATITDTGVIEDTIARGSRDLDKVYASQIRVSTPTNVTQFNFANSIGSIRTLRDINGLELTTGHLGSLLTGGNANGLVATVAGKIDSVHIGLDMGATSSVKAVGASGHIINFVVDGSLNGDVSASNQFDLLAVGQDVGASSLITAKKMGTKQIKGNLFGTIKIG